MEGPARARAVRQGGVAAGLIAATGGAVALVGWFAGSPDAVRLLPGSAAVRLSTAAAFVTVGLAVVASSRSKPPLQIGFAVATLAVLLPEILHAFGVREFGVGLLEIGRADGVGGRPNASAWGTSAMISFLALAVAFDGLGRPRARVATWLASAAWGGLAMLVVDRVGLPMDAPASGFSATVAAIVLLTIAAVGQQAAIAGTHGALHALLIDRSVRGQMIRRFTLPIPLVAVGPLVAATIVLRTRIADEGTTALFTRISTATLLAIIFVVAVTGNRVAASTSARLRSLAADAADVATGDFAVRPIAGGATQAGPDEFTYLTHSMAAMRTALAQRAHAEDLIRDAVRTVTRQEDLGEALEALATMLRPTAPIDAVVYGVMHEDDRVEILAVRGAPVPPPDGPAPLPHDTLAMIKRGEAVVRRYDQVPPPGDAAALLYEAGIRSVVVFPIFTAGAVRDLITFASASPDAFPPAVVEVLGRIVRETSAAIRTLTSLEEEREARRRLTALDQLKNEFIGIVAHDLRSPMSLIAGFSDTMLENWDAVSDEKKRDYLSIISRNVHDLSDLVEDVLQVARIESGEFTFTLEPFDIASLAARTLTEIGHAWPGRSLVLDAPAPVRVRADQRRTWRVLTNLLSNALKFSPDSAPVEVSVSANERGAHIAVRDHGPGIAPADHEKLFRKFSRIDAPEGGPKASGTGLGLYICKSLVEGQGGTIEAESAPGRGSTFRFTLPLETAEPGTPPPVSR